ASSSARLCALVRPITRVYRLSLHDALPIFAVLGAGAGHVVEGQPRQAAHGVVDGGVHHARRRDGREARRRAWCTPPSTTPCAACDRKSTRLNSSHGSISYAVLCFNKRHKAE